MENGEWEVQECSQHRRGESGMSAWSDGSGGFHFQREGQPAGGVCVWARTGNPTTLHSPVITASTTQQNIKMAVG